MTSVALTILVLALAPPTALTQIGTEATVSVAETLLHEGDRAGALEMAERIVGSDPFNVEAHHLIQRIMRRDDEAAMLARYRELARRYPGSPAAQYLYGNALLNAGDRGAASPRSYFERALQLDPGFGWAASIQAAFAQARGDTETVLQLLADMNVAEIRQDLPTATMYADLLRLNGLRDEALRFLEQAVAVNPDDPRFLLELWRLRMRGVDDYQAERASFSWQVAANRDRFLASPELTAELANFYTGSAMADPDGARQLWLALANRFPGNPEAKNALLRAAGMTDAAEEQIALYERVLADYPDSPIRYEVYYRMLNRLIGDEQYDRAQRTARGLTTAIDPGRTDDDEGPFERPTEWGFTLKGIGYAGWFAAAQAKAGAGRRVVYDVRSVAAREQPISPDALAAARALDASDCNDPRALRYVAQFLLESSYHRVLGIRLMERAVRASAGADPLTELAYGAEFLEDARAELERTTRHMAIYYALAGMTPQAEQAVAKLLDGLAPPSGANRPGTTFARAHYVAGRVYGIIGRWRDAARHYLIAEYEAPTLPRMAPAGYFAEIARIHAEIGAPTIQRYGPDGGSRVPLMRAGLAPVEGAASLDAEALGGDLLLLVFWSSGNERSIQQVLALDALSLELENPRLSTMAVAVQRPDRAGGNWRVPADPEGITLDRYGRFRRDTQLTIPLARADFEAIDRFDLVGLPTTILLDATGRVRARQLGYHAERAEWSRQWRAVVQEELAAVEASRRR